MIVFVVMMGCGYNELEEYNFIEEQAELAGMVNNLESKEICEVCNVFNEAYPIYAETMETGLADYLKNGGCCEKCFKKDFSVEWAKHAGVKDEQIVRILKNMELYGGKMLHYNCDFFYRENRLNDMISATLTTLHNVVYTVVNSLTKSKCDEQKPDEPDTPGHGGASDRNGIIRFDEVAYTSALKKSISWLLTDIGGDVEQRWIQNGNDLNLLRICYALNKKKKIDPQREGIEGRVGVLYGGNGDPYITAIVYLYRYLKAFMSPELLTLDELKERNEMGIVIARESAEGDFDALDGFVDVWSRWHFMSETKTISTEFYFFKID